MQETIEVPFEVPDGIEIVGDVSEDFKGMAYHFRTDEPITLYEDRSVRETIETQYFVVSSVVAPLSGGETMVFPADEDGVPINFGELAGGMRTGTDPEPILKEFADRYL